MNKVYDYDSLRECKTMCGFNFEFDESIEPTTDMLCLRVIRKSDKRFRNFICGVDLWRNDDNEVECIYTTYLDRKFSSLEELVSAVIERGKHCMRTDWNDIYWTRREVDDTKDWDTILLCRDDDWYCDDDDNDDDGRFDE